MQYVHLSTCRSLFKDFDMFIMMYSCVRYFMTLNTVTQYTKKNIDVAKEPRNAEIYLKFLLCMQAKLSSIVCV